MRTSTRLVVSALAASVLSSARYAHSAYCSGSPDPNAPTNPNPISDASPTLVREAPNGKLYRAMQGGANGGEGQEFYVTHVWGSAYEKGFAQGQLLASEIQTFYRQTWAYLADEIAAEAPSLFFPQWFLELVASNSLEWALDWTVSRAHTGRGGEPAFLLSATPRRHTGQRHESLH